MAAKLYTNINLLLLQLQYLLLLHFPFFFYFIRLACKSISQKNLLNLFSTIFCKHRNVEFRVWLENIARSSLLSPEWSRTLARVSSEYRGRVTTHNKPPVHTTSCGFPTAPHHLTSVAVVPQGYPCLPDVPASQHGPLRHGGGGPEGGLPEVLQAEWRDRAGLQDRVGGGAEVLCPAALDPPVDQREPAAHSAGG